MADKDEEDNPAPPESFDEFMLRQASFLRQRSAVLRPRNAPAPKTQNPAAPDTTENDRKNSIDEFRKRQQQNR